MKRLFVFAALLAAGMFGLQAQAFFVNPQAPGAPINPVAKSAKGSARFTETTHDFGEVKAREESRYVFEWTNDGDGPVKIEQVKTSCSCTSPSYSREAIAPGEKGFITVAIKPNPGVFQKRITATFDNDEPPTTLTIKGIARE